MHCQFGNCGRFAQFHMNWTNGTGEKHSGMVCATHDRELGRKNLMAAGMTIKEAMMFEHYTRITVELTSPLVPDWPLWLSQNKIHLATLKRQDRIEDVMNA